MPAETDPEEITGFIDDPDVAEALRSDHFRHILDNVPVAIAVSELQPSEKVTYANLEFLRLTGHEAGEVEGRRWDAIPSIRGFSDRLIEVADQDDDYLGRTDILGSDGVKRAVNWWANAIRDAKGEPLYRLVAAAEANESELSEHEEVLRLVQEKDTLMRELQHRVSNNLQMITTLIRLEARNLPPESSAEPFTRLAGRVGSLAALYRLLSEDTHQHGVDLGAYLSQIAAAVMQAHATEGVRLDLKVDSWPVSVNVAMPTGLMVNELMTNALKHAFVDREGGTITLHSLVDDNGCEVTVADDGPGLPEGVIWPQPSKLGSLILQSIKDNAGADLQVISRPGEGMSVTIRFLRSSAAPED